MFPAAQFHCPHCTYRLQDTPIPPIRESEPTIPQMPHRDSLRPRPVPSKGWGHPMLGAEVVSEAVGEGSGGVGEVGANRLRSGIFLPIWITLLISTITLLGLGLWSMFRCNLKVIRLRPWSVFPILVKPKWRSTVRKRFWEIGLSRCFITMTKMQRMSKNGWEVETKSPKTLTMELKIR